VGYLGEGLLQKAVNVLMAPVMFSTSSRVNSRAPVRSRTRLSLFMAVFPFYFDLDSKHELTIGSYGGQRDFY